MKILLAGTYAYEMYEEACVQALQNLGHSVTRFSWTKYFESLTGRCERKYALAGPYTRQLNRQLLACVLRERPEVLFVWRGTNILPDTLERIRREAGTFLVSFNNDDPFNSLHGSLHLRRQWTLFTRTIPYYDLHFVYRPVNVEDFKSAGARRVEILPPYFIPLRDRPVQLTDDERQHYGCDFVFVGHYEPDGRWESLMDLCRRGFSVKLFGTGWERVIKKNGMREFGNVYPVRNDDYAKALCGAKVALAFFSKLNRDVYTRRTFEIPATGTAMLSEYSREAAELYAEGKEALFFRSPDELLKKAQWLMEHDNERRELADAGRMRCMMSGYDVVSRMRQMMNALDEVLTL